jgi:DDE superfamily endonuclease
MHGLVKARARDYAMAVFDKGSPLDSIVGFIGGTAIEIARPSGARQKATYSGHKRRNCLTFQAVSAPDGLILHLFGPMEGCRHDMFMYNTSGIDQVLQNSLLISGRQYYLYGDVAYKLLTYLQTGFRGSTISSDELAFNASMSKVRVTVEWAFMDVKQYFTHVELPRKLRLRETPAGLFYLSSDMLWNFRVCLYGSRSAHNFQWDSIAISEYLEHFRIY